MKRTTTKRKRVKYLVLPLKNIGENPEFIKLFREAEADIAAGRTISHEEMMKEFPPVPLRKRRARREPRKTR